MRGVLRISLLRNCLVFSGSGVGGGSLVYGATLYEPLQPFYDDPQWRDIADWRAELAPHYDQAKRMLGVAPNPRATSGDALLREVAEELGVADTHHPTQVGIFFGHPGRTVPDPFFGGAGPARTGCTFCASCMTGCRVGAKNTTRTNYLYLAEQAGAQVHPLTTVVDVRPRRDGRYVVATRRSGRPGLLSRRVFTADHVVFAAAALGTQRLLHSLRDRGSLPHVSARLGELTRTNSEAIVAAGARGRDDLAEGVGISSSIHPDAVTHVEVMRFGKGSNALLGLLTPLVDGERHRLVRWLAQNLKRPLALLRTLNLKGASERTALLLVMQAVNNSLTTYTRRTWTGRRRMTTRQGTGEPNPTWIPQGHDVARRLAKRLGGEPLGMVNDVAGIPSTGHFIGGCPIGTSPESGVIDPYQRLFGHPGLHVLDGSAISANLGVNPSLTITAQAERALSFWPNKGEPDQRPALGEPYVPLVPVAPHHPAVPAGARGALRLVVPTP
jgi:cholesterol oxidase